MHHLDRAAGQAETQWPHGALASPVDELIGGCAERMLALVLLTSFSRRRIWVHTGHVQRRLWACGSWLGQWVAAGAETSNDASVHCIQQLAMRKHLVGEFGVREDEEERLR
jgi:hypothetical protein